MLHMLLKCVEREKGKEERQHEGVKEMGALNGERAEWGNS